MITDTSQLCFSSKWSTSSIQNKEILNPQVHRPKFNESEEQWNKKRKFYEQVNLEADVNKRWCRCCASIAIRNRENERRMKTNLKYHCNWELKRKMDYAGFRKRSYQPPEESSTVVVGGRWFMTCDNGRRWSKVYGREEGCKMTKTPHSA